MLSNLSFISGEKENIFIDLQTWAYDKLYSLFVYENRAVKKPFYVDVATSS